MPRILLFDSGVGGLSIYHELKKQLPDSEYHYYADHDAAPYGDKEDEWLNRRLLHAIQSLNQNINPSIIVIACNTASTLSLTNLREKIETPIIGVVPAIKVAAQYETDSPIGLLATPATINRDYTDTLINTFIDNQTTIKVGSTALVSMAEKKLKEQKVDLSELESIISPFLKSECQHVVLGCTHFPLLREELEYIAPSIGWIDSGEAIAKRTLSLIDTHAIEPTQKNSTFYSSSILEGELPIYLSLIGFEQVYMNYKI